MPLFPSRRYAFMPALPQEQTVRDKFTAPQRRRGLFGGPARGIVRREDGDPGTLLNYLVFGQGGVEDMRESRMNRDLFGMRSQTWKRQEEDAARERTNTDAAIGTLDPSLQPWARLAPEAAARAALAGPEQPDYQIDAQGRPYTIQNGRVMYGEGQVAVPPRGGAGGGMPSLSEARQWTNSYNDDVRSANSDLGNLRAAIPYASEVVRNRGAPTENARMNDVALLRAAARAQTGPGVLTESEVFGTLSPSLQQDLIRFRAYSDIAQTGLREQDRLALAQYVTTATRNASGDLWRRYNDAENVLAARDVDPTNVGISAPEYLHPDDMDNFLGQPLSRFRPGRSYVAPSGRQYEYLGDGRFRYTGRAQYDPARRVDRSEQPSGGNDTPPEGISAEEWAVATPEERAAFGR